MSKQLTPQQAAKILNISARQVLNLIDNGILPATRIGPNSRGGSWVIEDKHLSKATKRKTKPGRIPKSESK